MLIVSVCKCCKAKGGRDVYFLSRGRRGLARGGSLQRCLGSLLGNDKNQNVLATENKQIPVNGSGGLAGGEGVQDLFLEMIVE